MYAKMTVGRKIVAICTGLIVAALVQAAVALYSFSSVGTGVKRLTDDSMPGMIETAALRTDFYKLNGNYMHHMILSDIPQMDAIQKENDEILAEMHESLHKLEGLARTSEEHDALNKASTLLDQLVAEWLQVQPLSREGRSEQCNALYQKLTPQTIKDLLAAVDQFRTNKIAAGKAAGSAINDTVTHSFWLLVILTAGALICGAGAAFTVVRGVNGSLRTVVAELASSAGQIASAAGQVSGSSQSLAQGASEQAATIQETSSASSEINSMAQRNTENSQSATEVVNSSQQRVVKTNDSLGEMVQAMDGINASSQKISKIIKVIDEIAFQTNILALNAAVEAARAGEAGLGFAVVADEVRNLAQRSAQAAKDTANLIEESIGQSQAGKTKVDKVAEEFKAITDESDKMKILVNEINLGSSEQSRGIDQISRAISQIEQVTQSSAATAEECASAAEELNAQSRTMQEIVNNLTAMVEGSGGHGLPGAMHAATSKSTWNPAASH